MVGSPLHIDRLRLRHLRLLQLIDEQGSLRAVASVLNLTQPAVSQMVRDLEFAFGATLVERSVRGVELNEAGRLALQRARAGLATLDQLGRELDAGAALSLRIGTNSALMFNIIPDALRRLDAAQSTIRFHIETGLVGHMIEALRDGDLDCYVGRIDWDQVPRRLAKMLRNDPLIDTDLILICPADHPAARLPRPAARDLAAWPWAMPSRNSSNRVALETAMRNAGVAELRTAVEVAADPNGLINLALELKLLTCIPRLALDAHASSPALAILDVADLHLPKVHIGFATTAELQEMPAVARLRDALVAAAKARAGDAAG